MFFHIYGQRPVLKTFLTATLLLATSQAVSAQNQSLAKGPGSDDFSHVMSYIKHATLFNRVYPQEKVYLHFDNTGYFKGETIWFKAYVTRTDNGKPSDISRVLYVDLLNTSGNVIETCKLKINQGMAMGDFKLDSILGSGFYEVRAYTRYMLNFGDDCCFSRVFPVFKAPAVEGDYHNMTLDKRGVRNPLPQRKREVEENALSTDKGKNMDSKGFVVSFYPEGGDLVVGQQNRVAVSVIGKGGERAAVSGIVNDDQGNAVSTVICDGMGRGLFDLIPTDRTLSLVLTDGEGKRHQFVLPKARKEGCTMTLDAVNDDDAVGVTIQASDSIQGRLLGLTIMNGGSVYHADTLTADAAMALDLDRSMLRPGVNQLTLFTSDGKIQAERLFFICPPVSAADNIGVSVPKGASLSSCCPVTVNLMTRPNASVSFSALDASTMPMGREGSLKSYMLLESDLKGYISHPERFFESDDQEHRLAADSLMRFNGWRRYDWQLMADVKPWGHKLQQVEDHLYIFGHLGRAISKWTKSNPVGGVDLRAFLYNSQGNSLNGSTTTDSLGNYAFQLPDIAGDWNLQIETRMEDKLKTYSIGIDRRFRPAPRFIYPDETQMVEKNEPNLFKLTDEQRAAYMKTRTEQLAKRVGNAEYVLKTVKVKSRKNYWTDYSGGWHDEHEGYSDASLFYNCSDAAEEYADNGEVVPTLYDWLEKNNELFKDDPNAPIANRKTETPISGATADSVRIKLNMSDDGPGYNHRPTVWILNNKYAATTNATSLHSIARADVFKPNMEAMPVFLDEVKSVYIVENKSVLKNYILCSELAGLNPVIVFVYTYPSYATASKKGRRRTFFQGFNEPSTFQMEDYDILPPMDDFRRTIYWNPDVKTDATGCASVRFFNNSSCREMFISAEGMTAEGSLLGHE